jgi:hypothetical protein
MKKNITIIFRVLFYILIISFQSCADSENISLHENSNVNSHKRVNFSSVEDFNKEIDVLSGLDNDRLKLWAKENNTQSLLISEELNNITDEQLINLPDPYKAILNKNSEFVIGTKIIWLNNGSFYEFNESDEIEVLKKNVSELKPIGVISVKTNNISDANLKTQIGQNQLNSKYQYEFTGSAWLDCSNNYHTITGLYKYVHELMTVQTVLYQSAANSKLYLRIKLEWRSSSWKSASEPRDIVTNLNISGTQLRFTNGVVVPIYGSDSVNLSYTCSGDQTILLKSSDGYGLEGGSPYWNAEISGTIQHQLHGGYSSWTNYVAW